MAVVFKATSEFDDVLKDYDRLARKVVNLEQKNKQLTDGVKNQDKGFKASFTAGVSGLRSMVAGYASWQAAIGLVNTALAEQNRLSEQARTVQMTAADAQAEVIKNLGAVSTAHASEFLQQVQSISKAAGAESVAPVLEAAASTLSGTGGNEALTANILREAVPLFRNKLDQLPDFAGAVGDLASITGADSQEEIRRTVGLVLTTQSQARIASLDAFKNVAPALAAVATTDTSDDRIGALREGGALFAAIGGAIKDPEGALTKTATAEFATALQELLPENDILNVEGDVIRKGTGLKTLSERLARVQGDEKLQREFLQGSDTFQKASFRGPITPVIAELITNQESEAAQRFRSAFTKVQDDPRVVTQMLSNLSGSTTQLVTANAMREANANVEASQLSPNEARRAASRKILHDTLEQTRPGMFTFMGDAVNLAAFDMTAGDNPEKIAIERLRSREYRVAQGGMNTFRQEYELDSEAREDLTLLRKNIEILERMEKGIIDAAMAQQEASEQLKQLNSSAAGAAGNRETR